MKGVKIEDFFEIESLGVEVKPKCGNCRCGSFPIGGKDYTIKEERELRLIENGLERKSNHWQATYPWKRSPEDLPDNKVCALGMLKSTERRLAKSEQHQTLHEEQISNMISRRVVRKLTDQEIRNYNGPVHYLSHHEILKPDSQSTPCRIVLNSSACFNGHILNDYWAKGPDLLNNLLGILIRFREHAVAITGDISKMYHSVHISLLDQHTHRFLWRNMDNTRDPDMYMMQKVSFGDKPAVNIAAVALRKTAEEGKEMYPRAAELVLHNTYVDDMLDSLPMVNEAVKLANETDKLIEPGAFKIKKWIISGTLNNENLSDYHLTNTNEGRVEIFPQQTSKVLGILWDPVTDSFRFVVKLNFSPKRRKIRS